MAQHYAPEEVSGAVLATQFAEDLAAKGMDVTFLTAAPSYPLGKVYTGYRNTLYVTEQRNGVHIIRTWSFITPSKSFISRIINQITFSISCFIAGLVSGQYDILFSYSPPLPVGISASLLSSLKRIHWILRVEDLFPDTAIAGGALHNKTAIQILYWMERQIYRRATHISLISNTFKDILISKGIDREKLSVTPVWADPDEIRPGEKENAFRKRLGLDGKFVILYTGNIGHTSALEEIIPVAQFLHNNPDITFVIVGEGPKKQQLEVMASEHGVTNIHFKKKKKREIVQVMLASADLCLVTVNQAAANFSLPSKVFTYMASSRAILAISPASGEVEKLVQATNCGINVENGDIEEIISAIQHLYHDPELCAEMGVNGRRTLEEKYSRSLCINAFRQIILDNVN